MTQIKATIIADSIADSVDGPVRIITFELEYPRFIHSELMTHRVFSRNAASSRAIPIEKMIAHVLDNMAMPVYWGTNKPGMQAGAELEGISLQGAKDIWVAAGQDATRWSRSLHNQGLHKQLANRVTEAFQIMKTIVTTTERVNWYELRNHADAQPEIRELAVRMLEAQATSVPKFKKAGEWHLPYISEETKKALTIEEALKVSASCSAQVSYRKNDDSLEKAIMIYDRLVNSRPFHASPFEHQAKAMCTGTDWEEGVTHLDREGEYWSGNFKGWIQHRHLLKH